MSMRHHVPPVPEDGPEKWRIAMERQHQIPTLAETRNLARAGFSGEEIASLFRFKELYQRGTYHEATPEYKRLVFVRWLYQQGRMHS
jgi:hypothetical protein